jgi:hypothetical protein
MFNPDEAALLKQEAQRVYSETEKRCGKKSSGVARTAFAAINITKLFEG